MDFWKEIDAFLANPKLTLPFDSYSLWAGSGGISQVIDGRKIRLGSCRRQHFYRYNRYTTDGIGIDFENLWKQQMGHQLEEILSPILMQMGVFLGKQVGVSIIRETPSGLKYRIGMRMDFLVLDRKTGRPEAVELKTKGMYGTKKVIIPSKEEGMVPDVGDVLQCLPYLDWLRMPNQAVENPVANLCYLARDSGERSRHVVSLEGPDDHVVIANDSGRLEWPHVTLPGLYQDFDELAEQIARNEVPERDFELRWSRETVLAKYRGGELNKTDTETVKKRVDKGETGSLLDKGDWQCEWCDWCKGCYGQRPDFAPMPVDQVGQLVRPDAVHISMGHATQERVHIPGS